MRLKDTFITHDSDGEQVLIDVTSSFADRKSTRLNSSH